MKCVTLKPIMKASTRVNLSRRPGSSRIFRFGSALILCATVLLPALFFDAPVSAQMLDPNHTGMSLVWQQLYGASGLDPNGDADGDGVSNLQEALAGTNPFDSNS